ncbi:hypothetical protein Tco_0548066 [Tanacetum coccineum]
MDIKKKKEKRQIQEEKERRKAERADLVSERKGSSNTTIHDQSSIKKILPLEKRGSERIERKRRDGQEYSGTRNSYICRRRLTESVTIEIFGKVCAPVAAQGKTRALESDCKE